MSRQAWAVAVACRDLLEHLIEELEQPEPDDGLVEDQLLLLVASLHEVVRERRKATGSPVPSGPPF